MSIDTEAWRKSKEWKGWKKRDRHNAVQRQLGPYRWHPVAWIDCLGGLNIETEGNSVKIHCGNPSKALAIAKLIEETMVNTCNAKPAELR